METLERLSEQLAAVIAHSPALAPLAAFLGGALTALNPCVLAMVPLMVGFSAGLVGRGASERPWRRTLGFSLLFVGGFALELALLFTVFSGATAVLSAPWWRYVLVAVCAATALHLLGWLRLPRIPMPPAAARAAGALGAFTLGFVFGIVSLPCTGPVLLLLLGLVPRIGAAAALARDAARPIDDHRAPAAFRREVTLVLARRALTRALARAAAAATAEVGR